MRALDTGLHNLPRFKMLQMCPKVHQEILSSLQFGSDSTNLASANLDLRSQEILPDSSLYELLKAFGLQATNETAQHLIFG